MSSELDTSHGQGQDIITPAELEMEFIESQVRDLFQRGSKGEVLPSKVVSQILSVIQRTVAAESAKGQSTSKPGDTPGLEVMGWMLWATVDTLAREDQSHHDVLVGFINAFFPLLQSQPWSLWGRNMQGSSFLLGPQFRESFQGAGKAAFLSPGVPGATEEERRIHSWCNYCRFLARMTRDTEKDFSVYLLWIARDALEDCTWCPCSNFDAAVLAFEEVIDVCGVLIFQSDKDFGRTGSGGDGKRRWEGNSGFCRERWSFWAAGMLHIAQDEANHPAQVRDSARRTASKMQSIQANTEST